MDVIVNNYIGGEETVTKDIPYGVTIKNGKTSLFIAPSSLEKNKIIIYCDFLRNEPSSSNSIVISSYEQ